jgi:hypothetical protein
MVLYYKTTDYEDNLYRYVLEILFNLSFHFITEFNNTVFLTIILTSTEEESSITLNLQWHDRKEGRKEEVFLR